MPPSNRRIIRTDTMPHAIRQTSDAVQFGGLRVLVRELPAVGELDVPRGLDHFCFRYWPRPDWPMILRQGNKGLADSTDGPGRAIDDFEGTVYSFTAAKGMVKGIDPDANYTRTYPYDPGIVPGL